MILGAPDGVEVWLVDLAATADALAVLEAATPRLSDEECRWPRDGQDGIRRTTRIALRLLIERLMPGSDTRHFRQMALAREPGGRPSLPAPFPPRAFSLSHSGPHALIAIAPRGPLGVDLEAPRTLRMPAHRRAAIISAAATLGPIPRTRVVADGACDAEDHATLIAWTRLEAIGKARGTGVAAVLADHGVIARASPPTEPIGSDRTTDAAELTTAEPLAVHDLALPEGLVGAIATPAGSPCPPVRALPTDPARLAALANTSLRRSD